MDTSELSAWDIYSFPVVLMSISLSGGICHEMKLEILIRTGLGSPPSCVHVDLTAD